MIYTASNPPMPPFSLALLELTHFLCSLQLSGSEFPTAAWDSPAACPAVVSSCYTFAGKVREPQNFNIAVGIEFPQRDRWRPVSKPLTEKLTADLWDIYGLQMDTKHTWTLNEGEGEGALNATHWN